MSSARTGARNFVNRYLVESGRDYHYKLEKVNAGQKVMMCVNP